MLMQIHDELVFEVPPEERKKSSPSCAEMTKALSANLEVPLGVDVSVGDNWLEVEYASLHQARSCGMADSAAAFEL